MRINSMIPISFERELLVRRYVPLIVVVMSWIPGAVSVLRN